MTNKDFSDRLSERLRGMGYDFDAATVQAFAAAAKKPAECDMDAWVARFLRANRPHPRRTSLTSGGWFDCLRIAGIGLAAALAGVGVIVTTHLLLSLWPGCTLPSWASFTLITLSLALLTGGALVALTGLVSAAHAALVEIGHRLKNGNASTTDH